jgi:hypothetical protein
MATQTLSHPAVATAAFAMLAVGTFFTHPAQAARDDATVVVLTQTGCQFVESEKGVDHRYMPKKAEDCVAINQKTGSQRLAEAGPLTLKPGKYVFRVTNKNVPYSLGFWLRSEGYRAGNLVDKLSKTSVSGGRSNDRKNAGLRSDAESRRKLCLFLPSEPDAELPDYGNELRRGKIAVTGRLTRPVAHNLVQGVAGLGNGPGRAYGCQSLPSATISRTFSRSSSTESGTPDL